MFFFAYNILSIFLLFPVILYHLYRSVKRGRPPAFRERFGFLSPTELAITTGKPVIWLHAVSVGESIAARPLLKALRYSYPKHIIVISNTTETGRAISSTFPEKDICIYFPFDFLPAVCNTLKTIKPSLIIIMETEIWPNFTREANLRGIPIILANGRISDRSYSRYLKFRWFFSHALKYFSTLCMQTEIDKKRIIAIGAPNQRTVTLGNLKYDIPVSIPDNTEKQRLRNNFSIPAEMIVITAGSTHAGEEKIILKIYQELATSFDNIFLVLVPRHPERCPEVVDIIKGLNLIFESRTALSLDKKFKSGEVLLVDSIGEMMAMYKLSDIAFVGGSLVPTGGHNLLEPASVGVPTVFGSFMTNFREITELVLQYGAGIQVETVDELQSSMNTLIINIELRRVLGQNGLKMIRDKGGATKRHLEVISRYL